MLTRANENMDDVAAVSSFILTIHRYIVEGTMPFSR